MKKIHFISAVLFSLAICGFFGCISTSDVHRFAYDRDKGKEAGRNDFIELKSGETVAVDLKKYKIGMGLIDNNGSITTGDGKVYRVKDVEAFQMDSSYYKRAPNKGKRFYSRIKSGKINLYERHIVESGMDSRGKFYKDDYRIYFLQKGTKGSVEKFSEKLLASMITDNGNAMSLMTEYLAKSKKKRTDSELGHIIDVYNGKG